MYRIFKIPNSNYGTINSTQLPRIRNLIAQRLDYQTSLQMIAGNAVNNNHLLVKICYILTNYLHNSDVYGAVDDSLDKICNPLGITNSNGYGRLHYNFLYTDTSGIVAVTFQDQFIGTPWRDIRPLRVFEHPFTNMGIFTPTTIASGMAEKKISIIGIDLPLFAYQLKCWNEENQSLPDDQKENLAEFLTKYVLPKMINEYTDISVRNRIQYISNNIEVPHDRREQPFVEGWETVLDKSLKTILVALNGSNRPYIKTLCEIPMIYSKSYLEAIPMNLATLNSYTYWLGFYIYTRWAYPLLYLVNDGKLNNGNIDATLQKVDRVINNNQYIGHMSDSMKIDILEQYKKIKDFF